MLFLDTLMVLFKGFRLEKHLTPVEFTGIYNNLYSISDSWADLWMMLFVTRVPVGRILMLKYNDVHEDVIFLKSHRRYKGEFLNMNISLKKLIQIRAKRYPDDVYIFQSHSNYKKFNQSPLTLIAFNRALKIASEKVTTKTVSSKSAYIKQRLCYI